MLVKGSGEQRVSRLAIFTPYLGFEEMNSNKEDMPS